MRQGEAMTNMPPEVVEYLAARDAEDRPTFVIAEDVEGRRWYCDRKVHGWVGKPGDSVDDGDQYAQDLDDEQTEERLHEDTMLDEILERAMRVGGVAADAPDSMAKRVLDLVPPINVTAGTIRIYDDTGTVLAEGVVGPIGQDIKMTACVTGVGVRTRIDLPDGTTLYVRTNDPRPCILAGQELRMRLDLVP